MATAAAALPMALKSTTTTKKIQPAPAPALCPLAQLPLLPGVPLPLALPFVPLTEQSVPMKVDDGPAVVVEAPAVIAAPAAAPAAPVAVEEKAAVAEVSPATAAASAAAAVPAPVVELSPPVVAVPDEKAVVVAPPVEATLPPSTSNQTATVLSPQGVTAAASLVDMGMDIGGGGGSDGDGDSELLPVSTAEPDTLSQAELIALIGKLGEDVDPNGSSSELTPASLTAVMEKIQRLPFPIRRFVDIGCGRGKAVMAAVLSIPTDKWDAAAQSPVAYGIDIVGDRVNLAKEIKAAFIARSESLLATTAQPTGACIRLSEAISRLIRTEFEKKSFTDPAIRQKLFASSHVYAYGEAFADVDCHHLEELLDSPDWHWNVLVISIQTLSRRTSSRNTFGGALCCDLVQSSMGGASYQLYVFKRTHGQIASYIEKTKNVEAAAKAVVATSAIAPTKAKAVAVPRAVPVACASASASADVSSPPLTHVVRFNDTYIVNVGDEATGKILTDKLVVRYRFNESEAVPVINFGRRQAWPFVAECMWRGKKPISNWVPTQSLKLKMKKMVRDGELTRGHVVSCGFISNPPEFCQVQIIFAVFRDGLGKPVPILFDGELEQMMMEKKGKGTCPLWDTLSGADRKSSSKHPNGLAWLAVRQYGYKAPGAAADITYVDIPTQPFYAGNVPSEFAPFLGANGAAMPYINELEKFHVFARKFDSDVSVRKTVELTEEHYTALVGPGFDDAKLVPKYLAAITAGLAAKAKGRAATAKAIVVVDSDSESEADDADVKGMPKPKGKGKGKKATAAAVADSDATDSESDATPKVGTKRKGKGKGKVARASHKKKKLSPASCSGSGR